MVALVVILFLLLVLAVVAIAVWVWLFADIGDHTVEIARIEAEEWVALWWLQAIRRQAQAEMRRIRDAHRPRSIKGVYPHVRPDRTGAPMDSSSGDVRPDDWRTGFDESYSKGRPAPSRAGCRKGELHDYQRNQ